MPPRRKTSLKERNKPSAAKSTPKRKSLQELDAFAAVASSAVPIPTLAASSSPPPSTATTTTATKYSKAYIDMEAEDSDSSDEEVGERRQVHNLCERNRRHLIKEGFIMLQKKIPNAAGIRMSKIDTLRAAVVYIKGLQTKLGDLEAEVCLLRQLSAKQRNGTVS